jgi:hypothetical protein
VLFSASFAGADSMISGAPGGAFDPSDPLKSNEKRNSVERAGYMRGVSGPPLSANVRETDARSKVSVEGEQAKAAREFIIEPSPRSPALPDGSDVQGPEAALHRRVQEEGPAGGRRLHGARPDRLSASARRAVLVAPGDVAAGRPAARRTLVA